MNLLLKQYYEQWKMYNRFPKTKIWFGKFAGQQARDVNKHYLQWVLNQPATNIKYLNLQNDIKVLLKK